MSEFEHLLLYFEPICESYYKWHTIDGKNRKLPRFKANAKERLPTSGHKLFFLLVYLKNNPTQNFQAASFGLSQGQVSNLFKALNGLLSATLKSMGLMPAQNNEELQQYLEKHKISQLYQDVTERPIARKVDYEAQKEDFSGKKKLTQLRTQ
ncbi:transposase family protein [Arcicella aquatica]|uniref:Transposase family protein n=1 Tax=Arcicella aquatica TaxID=217141 RepID=A0ABU5QLI2_9BACT|nr:transposase family protein [Arcicella aquatica]MEA5257922.1 transposase family protein [Arcicella aquatica]